MTDSSRQGAGAPQLTPARRDPRRPLGWAPTSGAPWGSPRGVRKLRNGCPESIGTGVRKPPEPSDPETVFPRLVAARPLTSAGDLASVLHARTDRWVEAAASRRQAATDLIVGLIPRAQRVSDADLARALSEREDAIEHRAITLAEQAIERQPPWVRMLGTAPSDPAGRAEWMCQVRVVAAYRERWGTTNLHPVETPERAGSIEQLGHQERARAAADRALTISRQGPPSPAKPTTTTGPPRRRPDRGGAGERSGAVMRTCAGRRWGSPTGGDFQVPPRFTVAGLDSV